MVGPPSDECNRVAFFCYHSFEGQTPRGSASVKKDQTYNLTVSVQDKILEIVFTGKMTNDNYKQLEREFNTIVESTNVRNLLLDLR